MGEVELDARQAWNEGADAYADFIDSGADYYRHLVHGPGLLAACIDVAGRRVLDVGCGHDFFRRLLARNGASVVGVDLSDALLAWAAAAEATGPLGVIYRRMDAAGSVAGSPRRTLTSSPAACRSRTSPTQGQPCPARAASSPAASGSCSRFRTPVPTLAFSGSGGRRRSEGGPRTRRVLRHRPGGVRLVGALAEGTVADDVPPVHPHRVGRPDPGGGPCSPGPVRAR